MKTRLSLFLLILFLSPLLFSAMGCKNNNDAHLFVDDQADLLSSEQQERIAALNQRLLEDLDIHFLVVTLESPAFDLDAKAVELFDARALGEKTGSARGMLFLVDPQGKAVRLETGYDLEGIFTDAFTGYVEREQMLPFFAAGRIAPGIEATVEMLVARAIDAIEKGDYAVNRNGETPEGHLSGGGGAKTDIHVGDQLPEKPTSPLARDFGPQPSPMQALEKYMQVLSLHIKDPDLGVYTPRTRDFFRQWVVTNAQQDNGLRSLERVVKAAETLVEDNLGVIRFPIENRHASPYFLEKGDQGWMLDFYSMNQLIRFNHKNQWHFLRTEHTFSFAFTDLRFDKHGFPHRKPEDG
ncbi:MAG: TPM domain-containing protein [Thermodesulfobacteriota bacterium]